MSLKNLRIKSLLDHGSKGSFVIVLRGGICLNNPPPYMGEKFELTSLTTAQRFLEEELSNVKKKIDRLQK